MNRRGMGRWGETAARRHLEGRGYAILAANWRSVYGEVDLVARHGDTLVFVEVKSRRGDAFGTPEEALTPRKRHRLVLTALAYLDHIGASGADWRIDVIAVEGSPRRGVTRIEHYVDAVGGEPDLGR